jgi:hypothetical protein
MSITVQKDISKSFERPNDTLPLKQLSIFCAVCPVIARFRFYDPTPAEKLKTIL